MYKVEKKGYLISASGCYNADKKALRITYESRVWKTWQTTFTPGTCFFCASMHGRILAVDDWRVPEPPVHRNCGCYIEPTTVVAVGTATNAGADGVDLYVATHGVLPEYYISEAEAEAQGWEKWRGNLAEVLPGKMIGGKLYKNRNRKLPEAEGRIWHEADFDYVRGYRNTCRLLYSNDGLLFVTYDHYITFYEIGLENLK